MVTRVPNTELLAIKDQFGIQDPFLLKDYNDYMMDLVEEAQATGGVPAVNTQGGGGEGGKDAVGQAGSTNMGGGGGGAQGPGGNQYAGGAGGPGIVIVSYPYI